MQTEEFETEGKEAKLRHKGNGGFLVIRADKQDKERFQAMAKAEGFKSVSEWVRYNLLHPSLEMKVNRILSLLETKKGGDKDGKSKE